jgi:hypothetical protein
LLTSRQFKGELRQLDDGVAVFSRIVRDFANPFATGTPLGKVNEDLVLVVKKNKVYITEPIYNKYNVFIKLIR